MTALWTLLLFASVLILITALLSLCWLRGSIRGQRWACRRLHWHDGAWPVSFDGASLHATCRWCGKAVMLDSQGNWF